MNATRLTGLLLAVLVILLPLLAPLAAHAAPAEERRIAS
jgi:hypothetical protein